MLLKLVHIAGDTYYVPGLTNVGVYEDCVIDPGKNEHVDWVKPEVSFGRKFSMALITHAHNDHFWNASALQALGTKVYAPRDERPMIENIDVHMNGFFVWVRPPMGMQPWYFHAPPCKLDGVIEEIDLPIKPVPMEGHTDWHTGYLTPDRVLMTGDAMVDKKVWDKTGIVYHTNIPLLRKTLRSLAKTDAEFVMPSHTGLLSRDEARELAEYNLKGLDRLEQIILGTLNKDGVSTEDVVCNVCLALKMRDEFSVHLVGETTVRAFLFALENEGVVEYELKGHKVLWRTA